jgi:exodeoxyribonuclease VII large subunit
MRPHDSPVFTVSQLTHQIKNLLEPEFTDIWVSGEISNYTKHSSGHHYFTLKDGKAELSCTLWRSTASGIRLKLRSGMKAVLYGDVNVYELRGRYQLNVKWIVEEGVGQLELKLQELRERLDGEGLFDESHKKALPRFPATVALVTSPTGAAVRDMINIIRRRSPSCRIILCPVAVQGPGAELKIAEGIRNVNEHGQADVMIVGRGGGSIEDLWSFNEEVVARAIFESAIPVISAVGHQIDYTIADLVADLRAPTPSAAAEIALRDRGEMEDKLTDMRTRLASAAGRLIESSKARLSAASESYMLRRPDELLRTPRLHLDEMHSRVVESVDRIVESCRSRLSILDEKLSVLSPRAVLGRGYAVCRRLPDMGVVRGSDEVSRGEKIEVELSRGRVTGEVTATHDP